VDFFFFQLIFNSSRAAECMPNLKCLWLKSCAFPLTPGLLPKFKNLTSLEITSQQNIHEILAPIGPKLKELSLRGSSTDNNSFLNLLKVLTVCPDLEVLYLKDFDGSVQDLLKISPESSLSLKLKKIVLEGFFDAAKWLVLYLCLAPPLEEVSLDLGILLEAGALVDALGKRLLLQNMIRVDINLKLEEHVDAGDSLLMAMLMSTKAVARQMVCCCPKLQTINVNICMESDTDLFPFVELVKTL